MTNPYDEAVDAWKENQPKPAGAPAVNPYDAAVTEIATERQQRVRTVFEKALETNPDQAAEAQKLANSTGLSLNFVERNQEEVRRKQQARMLDLARMAQESPILARQLVDPSFTKQAHDDIGNLANVERTFTGTLKDIGTVAMKGAVGLPQAIVGLADLGIALSPVSLAVRGMRGEPLLGGGYLGKGLQALGVDFKRTQEILSGEEGETLLSYSPAQQAANKRVADVEGFTQTLSAMLENPSTIATLVGESLPQMLGGAAIGRTVLGLGAKAVGPAMIGPNLPGLMARQFGEKTATLVASAFGEGAIAGGYAAEQFRGENADGLIGAKETLAALGTGAGTALFSGFGGRVARRLGIEDIDTALVSRGLNPEVAETIKRGFVSSLVKSGISEGLFEEMPQSIQEQMWQNWANDKPLGQGVGKAAAQGVVAGFAMGGGFQAISRVRDHYSEINTAQTSAEQLVDLFNAAAPSALRERNPEQFRTVVQAMADNAEGAPSEIYIDAEVLNQLAPEVLAQLPQSVRDQIPDALAANDVVSIPTGDVLTIAPGTPLEQVLVENGRVGDPRAMTQVEANQAAEKAQEFLAQEAQKVIQQAADQQAMQESSDRVKQGVLDQLNTAGRFRAQVNEAYATWTAAFYTTMAGRMGMTPEQMAEKYPLRIAAQTGQGGVLNAGGGTLADVTAQWDAASITGDVYENRGVITLSRIVVPQGQREQGTGTAALQALVDYADRTGQRVVLSPSADFGGNKKRLMEFYKRFGFVENKGRNKDFAVSETMIREPQQVLNQTPGALPEWSLEKAKTRVTDAIKKAAIALSPKASLARRNYEKLDAIFKKVPDPLASEDAWRKFMSLLVADSSVLGVPYNALKYAQDPQAVADYLSRLRPDQLASRRAGFELGAKIRQEYIEGRATPVITGRLLLWAMLSRKAGAYPHEAAYMDLVNGGVDQWIEKAVNGTWTEADSEGYVKWSSEFMASKKGGVSPSAGVTSNANDFGRILLTKMSQKDENGVTQLTRLHNFIADQNVSTDQVRREFFALGDSLGIQNKVLSFALLVTGRWDTLVLDRVQFTHLWGDQYRERAGQRNIYDNGLATAGKGHFGLAVYEALARGMTQSVQKGYELAGLTDQGDGTLGAFHWDSWLIESSQAIGHPTIEALDTQTPRPDLAVRQGKFDTYGYNFEYRADGQYQIPLLDGSGYIILAPAEAAEFQGRISDPKEGVVPKDFKVSQNKASPWVDAEGVNRGRYDEILNEYGRRADAADVAPAGLADAGGPLQQRATDAGRTEPAADTAAGQDDGALNQGPRGTFNPSTLELALNENADLSTFLHETGHFFLEVMADLATQPGAPADIQQDMAALMKWFGVPDLATWNSYTLDEKRPYHERFAESFEQYLLEGKAPSLELQPLFRKFRAWMLNVYKSIKAFVDSRQGATDIQLSDEVRQVFDRMLASEAQIAEANEVAGLLPDQDADAEAVERLSARSLRDLKWTVNARSKAIKALQKQAAELRKSVEEEVTAEVEAQPVYAARKFLRTDTKLSIAALEEAYTGEGDRYALLDWKPLVQQKLAGKDGAHPDIVADMFGFKNGDELVQALLTAEPIADVIAGLTDQRMLEQHGDLVDQRAIEQAANEAVHNEARARSLATELKSQAEAINARTDTGQLNAAGNKITVNALMEAAKQFAANVVAGTPLRDLKSKTAQHTAAERRAGKRWQEHTAKGETAEAIKAKQDQVLNNAAAKAALEAQAEMRQILEFFKRVYKDGNEKIVEKGRDPDVVNAARAVLGAYGAAPRASKNAIEYMALVEKNDPAMFAALQPSVQGALNMAQPLESLTMEELRGLHEEIQAMWHLAKRSRMMEVDGNLIDMQEAEDDLQARMQAIGVPDSIPGESSAITPSEKAKRTLQFAGSLLRRTEQWAAGMGNEFTRLVFQPVKQAADTYRAERVKYRKRYQALIDTVAPALKKGLIEAPELGYTFGKGHNGIGHAELLHAILHTGNESNKRKLLLGRGWATENADGTMDTSKWDAFVKRAQDTGLLTKAHYDFAQGVWNLLEETKPAAQKTHRDVFGRYFAEVTADSFDTPFGTYAGGYVPAQADPRIVQDAALRDLATTENENMSFSFPSTNRGFTKGRVEYNRPLMLDLRTIGQHLDKVLLFTHMEPAVRDVNKLLSRKGVSYSLGRIDPTIYAGMLTPWLNRSARQIVETPIVGDGGISRVLSVARSRAGMALMFANISNTLQQTTGFLTAMAKLKADGLESQLTRSTAMFITNPRKMAREVAAASPFMASRMANEIAAMNGAMDDILLDPSLYEKSQAWAQKHSYFLQSAMANTMEPIIWTAGYNAALAKNMDDAEAVKYADSLIRQTQGSTLPEDVSRIETGPAYARVFTQFVGYFNMMANTNATALKQIAQEQGLRKGAGKALGILTLGMMAPLWMAEAIAIAMRGGPEDKDDDGYLDDWLAAVFGIGTIKGTMAMVPFIGQLVNASINRFNSNPADDKMSLSPAVSLLESAVGVPMDVYKAIADPEKLNARNAVRDVASAVSIVTGLPAIAFARPLGYLAGMADNRIEPTGPADLARGLVTGSASPESKQR
jgi:hypothetical protein